MKIDENDNELTRRVSTGMLMIHEQGVCKSSSFYRLRAELKVDKNAEAERDARRHSHIGTFRRGLSNGKKNKSYCSTLMISI